jgi:arylsulfatase A
VQLFNLKEDIGEQNDLARVRPKKAAKLLAKLHAWRSEVGARMLRSKKNNL